MMLSTGTRCACSSSPGWQIAAPCHAPAGSAPSHPGQPAPARNHRYHLAHRRTCGYDIVNDQHPAPQGSSHQHATLTMALGFLPVISKRVYAVVIGQGDCRGGGQGNTL